MSFCLCVILNAVKDLAPISASREHSNSYFDPNAILSLFFSGIFVSS
jgi:hypothetical protein